LVFKEYFMRNIVEVILWCARALRASLAISLLAIIFTVCGAIAIAAVGLTIVSAIGLLFFAIGALHLLGSFSFTGLSAVAAHSPQTLIALGAEIAIPLGMAYLTWQLLQGKKSAAPASCAT
jgi:hypothetical protein